MSSYPNRCQHIKINGTQCGSPALRRNKFCFFHKKWHEQRILINARHARRVRSIDLPVLEDANSIQVALMQVMRMTMSGELDNQKAGLLLYALQTASCNLRHTNFEPLMHDVVLDPRDAADTVLGQSQLWCDEDFEEEEDEAAEDQEDASDFAVNDIQAVSSPHARKTPRRADLVVARKVAGSANSRRESWSGRLDLNQRPPAPKLSRLAGVRLSAAKPRARWRNPERSEGAHRLLTNESWSGRLDLNQRPPAPKAGALPGCATPRSSEKV
jgi:hypothetical protein